MAALTTDRNTVYVETDNIELALADTVVSFYGAMVSMDATGEARPARATNTDICIGFNNTGKVDNADDGLLVPVTRGIARFENSASADLIADSDRGKLCYVVDDQTVALTDGGGARPVAGKIHSVDASGVFVDFRQDQGDLVTVSVTIPDISTADEVGVASPVAGRVVRVQSCIDAAITSADAVLTPKIGTTAMTGGAITVANAASAPFDVDESVPTAAHQVAAGDALRVATDGGSTTTSLCVVTFTILAD